MTTLLFGGHFIASKDGKLGLVDVTIRVTRVTLADGTQSLLVNDAACVEDTAANRGSYLYRLTDADLATYAYPAYMHTDDATVDQKTVACLGEVVQADLISILGAALSGTAAWIAEAFSNLFNVETPALTADSAIPTTAQITAAIGARVVEGTLTQDDITRIILAIEAGKASGGGTTTIIFRDQADTKARVTATVDENGNRTAVTVDGA